MPLTLPGLIGRVFAAAGNFFAQTTLSGDSFPNRIDYGDARIYLSDGTEDLTGTIDGTPPVLYVRARGQRQALLLRSSSFPAVYNILGIQAANNSPIMTVANAGGQWLNDNFTQAYSTSGPSNFISDIYGHLQLGANSAIRCSAGPPGNALTFADATGELFQRTRSGTQGSWTATNATYANAAEPVGFFGTTPASLSNVRSWVSTVSSGNITTTTSTSLTGYPKAVSTGMYPCPALTQCAGILYTASNTSTRSKTVGLAFYNAAGTQIGSTTNGTAVTDIALGSAGNISTATWTRLDVQAVSPVGTAYVAVVQTISSVAAVGETHYDTAAGFWASTNTAGITAWNAPFCYRTNQAALLPATVTASAVTGNGVSPIVITVPAGHPFMTGDTVTTTGFTPNTAANQVNASITASTSTSITIAGTGNGATSTGSVKMTASGIGVYDGAFAGDVLIRSDGPANVVQRFWTNATAGVPSAQAWTSDPRITSQPARLNWYGGNYLQQTGSTDLDYTLPNVTLGMLHNDPPDSVNRGIIATQGSFNLLNDASNAQAFGGMANFLQAVRKKNPPSSSSAVCAPYVSKDGMFALMYGLWDMTVVTSGGGAAEMTQLNATSTGAIIHTIRDMICHARASVIIPWSNTACFSFSGFGVSGTVQYAYSGGGPGVGGTFAFANAVNNSFTFTIPADFTGGAISFGLLGSTGAGGTMTWTGTLFSTGGATNPGPTGIRNTNPVGSRARVVTRFTNLTAAHAGLTIIGTVTTFDAGGGFSIDCAYIEGQFPNLVAICGIPRLVAAANYATLAGAGSYWNGNSGSTGDGDVQQLNTALKSLAAEFDNNVFYVDIDSALLKQTQLFATDGFSMGALGVHAMASQFVAALQAQLPLINFRNINHDYHDTTVVPIGSPFSKQGALNVSTGVSRFYSDDYYYISSVRASVNTPPQGQALIVDVLKNGSTIFTTTGNRPSIAAGANTAVSAAPPDLLFLQPGDYLTVNVAQIGSTAPGWDLTVNVLGRKIPIP